MPSLARTAPNPSLNAMIAHHARVKPAADAIVSSSGVMSFAAFENAVLSMAAQLSKRGIARGSRVAVALGETPAHLASLFAIARCGAIAIPVDTRWTDTEKQTVATALDAELVLVDDAEQDLEPLETVVADESWCTGHRSGAEAQPRGTVDDIALAEPFIFSLSSGTTGTPSGPALSQGQLYHRFVNQWVSLRLNGGDRFLAATPLYFGATRAFCLSTLCAGGAVILTKPGRSPGDLVPALVRAGATATFMVPTLLRRLLALDDEQLAPLRQLRVLISSGAALHDDERDAVRRRVCPNLFDYYGTTEGGGISILTPEDAVIGRGSVGRPAFLVDIQAVDAHGKPVPTGEVGRLRYRGPGVSDGPIFGPDGPVEGSPDGWFYPGDLASIREDGFIFLRGRDKEMILRGGVNIYPVEIEAAINRLHGVADVAVAGFPSEEFGEEIAAFVVADKAVTENAVIEHCRSALAPYKVPRRIIFCKALPRNDSGKINKASLVDTLPA